MIPRIVHQIWLQGDELPPVLGALVDGVRYRCWRDGWEHRLWTHRTADALLDGTRWGELKARCCHLSQRSNVLRYYVLCVMGGLYLDTDVELFGLPGDLRGAWIAGTDDGRPAVNPAVMASEPNHPYLQRLVEALPGIDLGVQGSAGPALAAACLGADSPGGVPEVWPRAVWHGRRNQRESLGHHYNWGLNLRSFKRDLREGSA